VVLKKASKGHVEVHDPAVGIRKIPMSEVSEHFSGIALELSPGANFSPIHARIAVSLRSLTGRVRGVIAALAQIFALAVSLEILALTGPFFLQWVVDQVLVSGDRDLLMLLGAGFLSVAIFSALITAARSLAITWLGAILNVQWTSNLFSHLMRLPLDWYEKRHVGDVVSRFGSIQSIQKTLTTQFIGSLLDGLMSVLTLAAMLLYSTWMTALVSALFALYGIVRWAFFSPLRRANEEHIVYAARQQSELLEAIRGSMPIKLANKQDDRLARYANATVSTINRDIKIQRLTIAFTLSNQLMFGIGRIALIWIGARLAIDNAFSAGMLIAFIAFSDQFVTRAAGLIDKWTDFRMLRLHAERIADIALTAPEKVADSTWLGPTPEASIELRNVSFRYAEGDPWIVQHCNLRVDAGQSIAFVGPSGGGKSTLAKIVLGLLEPTEGEVLFGGIDIRKLGLDTYRQWVGAVMQDDQLFAGSIADNIAFFDPHVEMDRVVGAAQLAAIHDDISAMPMGYQALVGDMGSSLSGRQKQRVILARALYRAPKLLVLDEATSHLDVLREKTVNNAIERLPITRIVISHRPETVAAFPKFARVGSGRVELVAQTADAAGY
jgi:ATP-binding cassette subfamily B protein RaxB